MEIFLQKGRILSSCINFLQDGCWLSQNSGPSWWLSNIQNHINLIKLVIFIFEIEIIWSLLRYFLDNFVFHILVRVTELETKLQKSQEEIYEIQLKRDQESGRALLTARLEMEREIEQYQTKATSAAKQVDLLKSEVRIWVIKIQNIH